MQQFSENYSYSVKESRLCPLCSKHSDSQESMATCDFFKSKFKGTIQLKIENIYSERVTIESVKIICKALVLREKAINKVQ